MQMSKLPKKPPDRAEKLLQWVQQIMKSRSWTATELARRAELAPSTLLRALNKESHPFIFSKTTLQKIADAAGEKVPQDLFSMVGRRRFEDVRHQVHVRYVSAFPAKVHSSFGIAKPELVDVPVGLQRDETLFAFRNPDNQLGAWFPLRSLMFATQSRDPAEGDLLMLTGRDGRTKVRLLLSISEAGLRVSKTMPAMEDETIPFDDIADIGVVVDVLRDREV